MRRLAAAFALFVFASCGDGATDSSCDYPTTQGLTMPCCESRGVDACGAGLFCAAFDGRRQATCYSERSRSDGASCTADLHCMSGSCDPSAERCRALPGTKCEAALGCAPDTTGHRYVCLDATCVPVGNGGYDQPCVDATDCASDVCENNHCVGDCRIGNGRGPCTTDRSSVACNNCITSAIGSTTCWNPCNNLINECASCRDKICECECEVNICVAAACPGFAACF
ncbi:hypothetical protein [Vulgatibacter incomptus]|uniref:hypothetical protein n=1 Tax=Vulgatibacter incomptus TaxID=1391653 RepID=UPI0006836611|nr:hypothetical protein [Vulgatibacter incomptus]